MALNKKLQNPKRSSQDPTELNAQLAAMQTQIDELEERVEKLERLNRINGNFMVGVGGS